MRVRAHLLLKLLLVGGLSACSGPLGIGAQSSSPNASVRPLATSGPCSPKPCALVRGLELLASGLERNAPMPADLSNQPSGAHYVRLTVTFIDVSGEHAIDDPRNSTSLIDEGGPDTFTQGGPGATISYRLATFDWDCGQSPPTSPTPSAGGIGGNVTPPVAQLKPGQRYGPTTLCFWVSGAVNQRLKLAWVPFDWPNTPGVLYTPLEIPL